MRGRSLIQSPESVYSLDMDQRPKDIVYRIQNVNESFLVEMFYSMSRMLVLRRSLMNGMRDKCVELDSFSEEETVSESEPELRRSGREKGHQITMESGLLLLVEM